MTNFQKRILAYIGLFLILFGISQIGDGEFYKVMLGFFGAYFIGKTTGEFCLSIWPDKEKEDGAK